MSKELLYRLNGNKNGRLKEYLDSLKEPLNIAWYPSAGLDFRPTLYLSQIYSETDPASIKEDTFPNFFIYTDYLTSIPDTSTIYEDSRTKVIVENIEELPRLGLPLNNEIVAIPGGSAETGKVVFIEIKVTSNKLGEFKYPVIYASVENEAFCSKILLPMNSDISHIMHVKYGGGLGGAKMSGVWLLNVLKRLNCKIFVTDGGYQLDADQTAFTIYPNLNGDRPKLDVIRTMDKEKWSNLDDVTWNIVK